MNANFALNETFLDTAQLRASVVSHAKLLGYTPRSIAPSVAVINVKMNYDTTATPLYNHDGSNNPLPLSMPRGTKFQTLIDGVTYPMFASATATINFDATDGWVFPNVNIEQGTLAEITYTYQNNVYEQYLIPVTNVNTKSIKVTVIDSSSSSSSKVYTLKY